MHDRAWKVPERWAHDEVRYSRESDDPRAGRLVNLRGNQRCFPAGPGLARAQMPASPVEHSPRGGTAAASHSAGYDRQFQRRPEGGRVFGHDTGVPGE
jgi:hypothetical protein